jgi:hypothetical protein
MTLQYCHLLRLSLRSSSNGTVISTNCSLPSSNSCGCGSCCHGFENIVSGICLLKILEKNGKLKSDFNKNQFIEKNIFGKILQVEASFLEFEQFSCSLKTLQVIQVK